METAAGAILVDPRSEMAFRSLVEAAQCMILILQGRHIAYFSPFAETLTGYTAGEVEGQDYCELFLPPEHRQAVAEKIKLARAGNPGEGFESPVQCRHGSTRWMVFNARGLEGHDRGNSLLLVGQDITNLKEAQELLLQSERLAAIGQMVAGLAHESRNALQRSQACLSMLAKRIKGQSEAEQLLAGIQEAQQDLYHLYDGVRAYAAPIRLNRQPCSLVDILHEAWSQVGPVRQGRQVRLSEVGRDLDACCEVDRFAAAQAFRNILENSLTACRDPVSLEVIWSLDQLDQAPAVRVSLIDNGPGLNSEQRQRIFEPFYTTKTHGTGLGMPITKRIVEAHGGRISLGAGRGRGAEIVLHWRRSA
ncbi:MAG: ATP-binding protein [Pirellulales bacterium]